MALNDIVFIKGQGGLGRPLNGEDFISGLIFYTNNLPTGFGVNDRVKLVNSVTEAEALGILDDFSDATPANGVIEIIDAGNVNDTCLLQVTDLDSSGSVHTTTLVSYTRNSTSNTISLIATDIINAINNGTINHGYSADSAGGGNINLYAPKKFGTYLNTGTPISFSFTGNLDGGVVNQFTNGTASQLAIWHYHVAEFFRLQPKGQLWLGFFAVPANYDFTEIETLQNTAMGKVRQVGIFKNDAFSSGNLTTIHNVCKGLGDIHKPLSALYAADLVGVTDLTTLPDLNQLTANLCSAIIGQDGGGRGRFLFLTTGVSISVLGATLGAVAYAKVSEDIAWISKFNISNGLECDTIGFSNGQQLTATSQNTLNLLDDRRYIFLIKYVGIAGSYFNDSHCAVAVNSDYAYIENNRTIDKAIRGVYSSLLPSLNSPLQLNADGTLLDTTIAFFIGQAGINLDQMVRDTELSAFEVTIDTTQNVLSTSTLVVSVKLVPIGVARNIVVNIGFTLSI